VKQPECGLRVQCSPLVDWAVYPRFEAHYAVGGTGHNRETGGNVEDVGNVGVI
jgi:hypothetical protein